MKAYICPACMNDAVEQGDEIWCIRSNDYVSKLCHAHADRNLFVEQQKALNKTVNEFNELMESINGDEEQLENMNLKSQYLEN